MTHAKKILQQLQTLEIAGIKVQDDRSDLLKVAKAIKNIIDISRKLESVAVMKIGPRKSSILMRPLSVEDLFSTETSRYKLSIVKLNDLEILNRLTVVNFIELHARSLKKVFLRHVDLRDVRWSEILDDWRDTEFPDLEVFDLLCCFDDENHGLNARAAIRETHAAPYLLHQTDQNPRVMPSGQI